MEETDGYGRERFPHWLAPGLILLFGLLLLSVFHFTFPVRPEIDWGNEVAWGSTWLVFMVWLYFAQRLQSFERAYPLLTAGASFVLIGMTVALLNEVYAIGAIDEAVNISIPVGEVLLTAGLYFAVTTKSERDAELEEAYTELDILNKVLRHDIRNNMNLVVAWADELGSKLDGEERETCRRVEEVGREVVEVTKTARDLSEVVTGSGEVVLEPVPLDKHLGTQVEMVSHSFSEAEFSLTGPLDLEVQGSPLLSSVFRNLLHNAVHHNDSDKPEVGVEVVRDGGYVTISIADNGPGIGEELKERLFGKGQRGMGSSGSGIGLYLVKTIVEKYGGEVWVEDNEPRGAVFKVRLIEA